MKTRLLLLAALISITSVATGQGKTEAGFKKLFDGKTFNGWKTANENQQSWSIKDGAFVAHGNRPFEKRKFDAEAWRGGDAQTRGEMSEDLQFGRNESNDYYLSRKSHQEILELLGEPDRKTRGKCCGAGGARWTSRCRR